MRKILAKYKFPLYIYDSAITNELNIAIVKIKEIKM